jgi:hypothetical protein
LLLNGEIQVVRNPRLSWPTMRLPTELESVTHTYNVPMRCTLPGQEQSLWSRLFFKKKQRVYISRTI